MRKPRSLLPSVHNNSHNHNHIRGSRRSFVLTLLGLVFIAVLSIYLIIEKLSLFRVTRTNETSRSISSPLTPPPPPPPPSISSQILVDDLSLQTETRLPLTLSPPVLSIEEKDPSLPISPPSLPISPPLPPLILPPPLPESSPPLSPIRLLSTDFHIGPIADLKYLVSKFFKEQVHITDYSLSGACTRANTCARREDLKVLVQGGWEEGIYASSSTKRLFFDSYKDGGLPFDQDVFHCSHPTGMCEFFMPFDIPMIVWATTRFEQGREGNALRFSGFVQNFIALAKRPGTVILANNLYDLHYIKYFTGVTPLYVQSHCAYPGVQYAWGKEKSLPALSKRDILVSGFRPKRALSTTGLADFISPLISAAQQANLPFTFKEYRQALGDNYLYSDLVRYPAILYIPYQVSIMSFYEQYNMGIPLLAPSLSLLTQWHMDYLMVSERTWDTVLQGSPKRSSAIPRHASVADSEEPFDPNDEFNKEAVSHWLSYSDFYHFPHIILFDSWQDAVDKLAAADLEDISRKMLQHSKAVEQELVTTWGKIFKDISKVQSRKPLSDVSYHERMNSLYGEGKWSDY